MNYKILILTGLFIISPLYTNPITLDPVIKKAVHSFARLSGVAAGLFVSTKLWKRKWDAQCKWAFGIFGVGIASFFYTPKFNQAQQFIINNRRIHPDLKKYSPTKKDILEKNESSQEHIELIKLPRENADEVFKILQEVAKIKTPFTSRYKSYAEEFSKILESQPSFTIDQSSFAEGEGENIILQNDTIPLSPAQFVRYVLPCYNVPHKMEYYPTHFCIDDEFPIRESFDSLKASFWRLNKYLNKNTKLSTRLLPSAKLLFKNDGYYDDWTAHKLFYKSWQALGYEVTIKD